MSLGVASSQPLVLSARERDPLRLLVLHDDAEREFDYDTGAEHALEKARADGWTIVSIANDWATGF